ncbi:hypothetical protein N7490_008341 [Penicillium lividum]|nr:hypothetical protein N7490_008341 [Penicillium lividum]
MVIKDNPNDRGFNVKQLIQDVAHYAIAGNIISRRSGVCPGSTIRTMWWEKLYRLHNLRDRVGK